MAVDRSSEPGADSPQPAGQAAERLVARLCELSQDLRAVALFDGDELLAASAEGEWAERGAELWRAADAIAADGEQVHVGGADGELFALRHGRYSALATSDRFTLASLMFCDLRAALRDLDEGGV